MADDGEWLDDEEMDELPVLSVGEAPAVPAAERLGRQRRRRPFAAAPPKGGVSIANAGDARRQALADATGRSMTEPGTGWRDELAEGNRGRAIAKLSAGGRRGNGSGFGLA